MKDAQNTQQTGTSSSKNVRKDSSFSIFGVVKGILTTLALILIITASSIWIFQMLKSDDKVVVETKKSVTITEPLVATTPTVSPEKVEVKTIIVKEEIPEQKIVINKDSRQPVEWRKVNFAKPRPGNREVYYLAWKKDSRGSGPASWHTLDANKFPSPPEDGLKLAWADPQLIEDLGFKSKSSRKGMGLPVLLK